MKKNILVLIAAIQLFSISEICSQNWIQKQNYPVAAGADGGICFSISNKIYAGGGINSRLFREYDPSTNQWTPKQNIPGVSTDRSFGIGFSVNGKGYVGLGLDGSTPKNDLWEYDPVTNGWSQKQNFPGQARDGLYCFVIDSIAYVGAGEDPFTTQQFIAAYAYSPATDTWAALSDFPTSGIIYPFSFSIGNKGYVSCGQTSVGGATSMTFEYDPSTDNWSPGATFPGAARQAGVSFVLGSKAFCGLGMDVGFYNDFYSYDTLTGTWSPADSLPAPGRSFPAAAVANNTAYVGLGWSFTTSANLYLDWWEFSLPTGLTNLQNENVPISVYPNPASQYINIGFRDKGNHLFKIVNKLGEIIQSGLLNDSNNVLDISRISNGIYSMIISNDKMYQAKLFIKN